LSDPKIWQSLPAGKLDLHVVQQQLGGLGATLDPADVMRLQQDYADQFAGLWQSALSANPPAITDRRMAAEAWHSNPFYAFQAAAYQLNGRFLMALADSVKASEKIKQKLRFAVQQMVDALSPANFLVTESRSADKSIDTKGEV